MTEEIMKINCYGKEKFEADSILFNSRDELVRYCSKKCKDDSKPDRIYIYFIGMVPTDTIEEIADWKRKTLDTILITYSDK